MKNLKRYLPSLEQVSQEAIAVAIASIGVAYLIAKVPALKQLVKNYSTSD